MSIATPATGKTLQELTPTDVANVKSYLDLNGNDIFELTFAGAVYNSLIELKQGYLYYFVTDTIIGDTDTIKDVNDTEFTVSIQDYSTIGIDSVFQVQIIGSTAYCIPFKVDIQGIYSSKFTADANSPFSIYLTQDNVILLTNVRVEIYDNTLTLVTAFNHSGGSPVTSASVAATNSLIFVSIAAIDAVKVFDYSGTLVDTIGSLGTGDGQFDNPLGVTVDSDYLYVSDSDNFRIQVFTHAGVFQYKFGSNGSGDGQFITPIGIAVDRNYIYVVDSDRDDVQIFDHTGTFQSKFGGTGTADGLFDNPLAINVNNNSIIVGDSGNARVQLFTKLGVFKSKFGSSGTGLGQFQTIRSLAANEINVYVVDALSNDIQIFK